MPLDDLQRKLGQLQAEPSPDTSRAEGLLAWWQRLTVPLNALSAALCALSSETKGASSASAQQAREACLALAAEAYRLHEGLASPQALSLFGTSQAPPPPSSYWPAPPRRLPKNAAAPARDATAQSSAVQPSALQSSAAQPSDLTRAIRQLQTQGFSIEDITLLTGISAAQIEKMLSPPPN